MEFLPAFLLFSIVASFTPGPNNIMIMASGLNFGVRRSLPHLAGIAFGFSLMLIAVGSGAGYVFERFPSLHELIKVIGMMYLLYLAWRIANSSTDEDQQHRSKPFSFVQAALFQWVNPKAWIMGTSALATYTTIGANLSTQIALIVAVFFIMAWLSAGTWLVCGSMMRQVLKNPANQRRFNIVMALLLLASMYDVIFDLISQYLS